jgi:hypothetical protein
MGKFSWLLIYFCGCRVGFDLSMCFTLRRKNKRARSAWPAPPPGDSKYFVLLSFICLYSPMVRVRCLSPIDSIGPKSWEGAAEFSHTFCRFLRVHLTRRTARDELVAWLQQQPLTRAHSTW